MVSYIVLPAVAYEEVDGISMYAKLNTKCLGIQYNL